MAKINRKKRITVYLAGQMESLSSQGCTSWRNRVTKDLIKIFGKNSINIIDPCKCEGTKVNGIVSKDSNSLAKIKEEIKDWKRVGDWEKFDKAILTIIEVDLQAVRDSDFIIVYLDFKTMTGTASEITEAYRLKKKIYTVTSSNLVECNSWLLGMCRSLGKVYPSFKDAVQDIRNDYREGKHDKI